MFFKQIIFGILLTLLMYNTSSGQISWAKEHEKLSSAVFQECNHNKAALIAAGKWPYKDQRLNNVVYLNNPIAAMPGMYDYGFYHIPYGVDQLPGPGISDFYCHFDDYNLTRTFEECTGTVFEIVPNGYQPLIYNVAQVVAAAEGIIVAKSDGNYDQRCSSPSGGSNFVVLEHSDGSRTYYYDLKNGTQTGKTIGSILLAGEYIGHPAGSGSRSPSQITFEANTRLFFELRDSQNNVIDPFGAPGCRGLPEYPDRWKDSIAMKKYAYDGALLLLKTLKHKWIAKDVCGKDIRGYTLHFNPGDSMYIEVGFKNFQGSAPFSDSFFINILNPVGIPIINTIVRNQGCICPFYKYRFLNYLIGVKLPSNSTIIPGTYTIVLNYYNSGYGSSNYKHYFTVGCQNDYTLFGTETGDVGTIAGNNIYTTQTCNSGSRVKLIAGNQVILSPGFHAKPGSSVMIYNDLCVVPAFAKQQGENLKTTVVSDSSFTVVSISPNPFTSSFVLTLNAKTTTKAQVTIFNSMGVKIKTLPLINTAQGRNQITVEGSSFAKGVYLVEVVTDEEKITKKIVKI